MNETKLKYRLVISGYGSWQEAKEEMSKSIMDCKGFVYIEGYNPDGVPA